MPRERSRGVNIHAVFVWEIQIICLLLCNCMIDRATIDRIMDATNIVDVVSEFVSLRKSGTSYKGLCPFHDDRTPSFSVSPSRGVYKCFSCGKAGNAVNFIMEHEQMTYPDALKWLAKKYGIEVKERELSNEEREQENERESIFIVNEWAADYFQDVLFNDVDGQAIGLAYFRSRGFRDDIIRKFRLGFALNRRNALIDTARKKGYKDTYLVKSGLCGQRENGTLYERFNGRVMFPWLSVSGKVTAFGGRLLDSRTKGVSQKYVNSPDSVIYHKDHELYGIYQARKAIVKEDKVFMVEGYTDVISMHQCGIENVVANSGTALSIHQIKILRRFTPNIVLLYDGDEAGIHAALRGTDMLLAEGMNIKVLLLPDNDDPDSFARKHTATEFREYVESHQTDFMEFKTQVLLKGVTDPFERSKAITSIVKSISVITDQIVRATYIKDCAQRIGIAEQTLINEMNKIIRNDRDQKARMDEREASRAAVEPPTPVVDARQPATVAGGVRYDQQLAKLEMLIAQLVVRHGGVVIFPNVENDDGTVCDLTVAEFIYVDLQADGLKLRNAVCNTILEEAVVRIQAGKGRLDEYFMHHPDLQVSTLATRLGVDEYILTDSLKLKEDEEFLKNQTVRLLLEYRMVIVRTQLDECRKQMASAADDNVRMQILTDINSLNAMRLEIAKRLGNSIII